MARREHTPKAKSPQDDESLSKVFTQSFPIVGEVPIAFYIPDSKSKPKLQKLIEDHGGIVINSFEPYMYQIKIERECKMSKHFYIGDIYTEKMIYQSIKRGKMVSDVSTFKLGINKHGMPHKKISRERYTFIEAVKIFEIMEDSKDTGQLMLLQFWQKVEAKFLLPGRTSMGLRGAYRKFVKLSQEEVLRSILKDEKGRYSHYFQYPPSLNKEGSMEKTPSTQVCSTENKLSPVRANLLSDEEEDDFEVEEQASAQEFLLAVDELESVLSYNATNDRTYNIQSNIKKLEVRNLDRAYTEFEEKQQYELVGKKRLKISEETEIPYPIYDSQDLHNQ